MTRPRAPFGGGPGGTRSRSHRGGRTRRMARPLLPRAGPRAGRSSRGDLLRFILGTPGGRKFAAVARVGRAQRLETPRRLALDRACAAAEGFRDRFDAEVVVVPEHHTGALSGRKLS